MTHPRAAFSPRTFDLLVKGIFAPAQISRRFSAPPLSSVPVVLLPTVRTLARAASPGVASRHVIQRHSQTLRLASLAVSCPAARFVDTCSAQRFFPLHVPLSPPLSPPRTPSSQTQCAQSTACPSSPARACAGADRAPGEALAWGGATARASARAQVPPSTGARETRARARARDHPRR